METIEKENSSRKFTLASRIKSFGNAFSGIKLLLKNEHNFRIHIFILVLVVIAGLLLKLSVAEWIAVAIVSGMVLSAECFNTAIEYLSDSVTKDPDPGIKKAKDTAAAGVLISAIIAVIVGLAIFIPRIYRLL